MRLFSIVLCLLAVSTSVASAAGKPNILLILVDDLGYADLACCGSSDMRTPHVDALAARGMRFTSFYANCPVCSPTRAAILSGRYQELVGVPGVIRTHADNSWGYLDPHSVLLPGILKQAGYRTAAIGKWHLGLESPNRPHERGFEHFKGFLGDMMDDYYNHRRHGINYMFHNDQEIDPEGHATDLFSQWAVDFLKGQSDEEPFFLYLAYNAPHTPIQPPDEWGEKVKAREPGITDRRAKLVALIEHLDDGIGKVLRTLDETGLSENTLVIFTSDNGGQLDVGANNGPLRDGKQSMYEGGLKVPTIVAWPGNVAAGTQSPVRAMSMDLTATICDVAGTSLPDVCEGRSILPTLRGESQKPLRKLWFFTRREGGTRYGGKTIDAVIRGDWKLLQNSPYEPLELYNLTEDPAEEHNLINSEHKVFTELAAELRKQLQKGGRIPWQKPDHKPINGD